MDFILNFQSPKTLEDLWQRFECGGFTNIDFILDWDSGDHCWTVDKKTEVGDLVFFSCAKTSVNHMARLVKELSASKDDYLNLEKFEQFSNFAHQQYDKYRQYAGQLVAVGRIIAPPLRMKQPLPTPHGPAISMQKLAILSFWKSLYQYRILKMLLC